MSARSGTTPDRLTDATQRIDKWLWFARLVKTRTLATRLVTGGKIRINREKIDKASHSVKAGDVVTARVARKIVILKILDVGARRGPAKEAQLLYEDLTPDEPALKKVSGPGQKSFSRMASNGGSVAVRSPGSGRPTKRERRQLRKLRGEES